MRGTTVERIEGAELPDGLRAHWRAWLGATDRKRIRVSDIASAEAMTAFVAAGLGWAIVSAVVAREASAAGRIDLFGLAPPLFRDLVLVWRADLATRPVIAAALAVFSSHAGDE